MLCFIFSLFTSHFYASLLKSLYVKQSSRFLRLCFFPPLFSSSDGDSIKVFVRVRPLTQGTGLTTDGDHSLCLAVTSDHTVRLNSKPEPRNFTYDHVADMDTSQVRGQEVKTESNRTSSVKESNHWIESFVDSGWLIHSSGKFIRVESLKWVRMLTHAECVKVWFSLKWDLTVSTLLKWVVMMNQKSQNSHCL